MSEVFIRQENKDPIHDRTPADCRKRIVIITGTT